jgi:hypothetical protein
VTYDLYFWPSGAAEDPRRLADRLAEEEVGSLASDARVLAFRADLLRRWPDLADMIAPWDDDLAWRQPWGRTDLADRFVGLTLPYQWEATSALPALAGSYGLDCYDPQSERLVSPRPMPTASDGGGPGGLVRIGGWVADGHVVRFLQQVSAYIGYRYDDLDEAALVGALDGTDDETADGWFEYPLQGTPPLIVGLAQALDGAVVSVRVEGAMDTILAARIETVLDML